MDYIALANEMRSSAWAEMLASPAFKAFRAADNMVVELGGNSAMPGLSPPASDLVADTVNGKMVMEVKRRKVVRAANGVAKPTQADAAVSLLNTFGPIGIFDIVELAKDAGAAVGGANPINNYRSALSKDERFYSFRHDGKHLWWLTGVPLPEGWGEAADDLLAAASPNSNQEGGDGHAATMS